MQSATQLVGLRVWKDEDLGKLWRVAYNEGDGEMIVSFPDTAALGDFIMERLGLSLQEEPDELQTIYQSYVLELEDNTTIDTTPVYPLANRRN